MDFETARRNMIECQIRTNRVTDDRILSAMLTLPRERFLPAERQAMAYVDRDIPCGGNRSLAKPMMVARMTQEASIGAGDVVLCVGSGTGYCAAVLAKLANTVFALESEADHVRRSGETLAELGLDNVVVVEGPLKDGWPAESPFDVIFFTGAVAEIPTAFFDQLAEGGRLVAVIEAGNFGQATLFVKIAGTVSQRNLFDGTMDRLPEFDRVQEFVF